MYLSQELKKRKPKRKGLAITKAKNVIFIDCENTRENWLKISTMSYILAQHVYFANTV